MRGRNWEQAWRSDVGPAMVNLVQTAQETSAAGADAYMATVLAELGIPSKVPTQLNIPAFAGVAGNGSSLESVLYGGVISAAKAQYQPAVADLNRTALEDYALNEAAAFLEEVTATIMADVARAAEAAALAERPWVDGFVRMLDPKNPCSRCVLLAGKFYLYNEGFDRHPQCRCTHIPYMENMPHDVLTNPSDYFHSLSSAEQERVFTVAGAEAIRMGADISQVVNARRGMRKAQLYGRDVLLTTTGTTRTGVYGHLERMRGGATRGNLEEFVTRHTRNGPETRRVRRERAQRPRLMPETILAIAQDREDAIRLLRLYGYLLGS